MPVRVCSLLLDWVLIRERGLANLLLNSFLLAELGVLPKANTRQQRANANQKGVGDLGSCEAWLWESAVGGSTLVWKYLSMGQ